MKFKMKKNNLRIVSFLLALLMVVNSVLLPARADVEAFVETFPQKTEDFNYSAASPSEAEKVCGYCGEIDCENEYILCEDCGKENCICDLDVASPSEAVKVCEDCGADPCECEICEECEKDPCECNNTKKLMLFTTAKSQTKEFDLDAVWASASNAVYNSFEGEYKIGFVDDENESFFVFGDTTYTKVKVSNSPKYMVVLGEYVSEEDDSVLMYEIDSFDDDFYFSVLAKQSSNYIKPDAVSAIVGAEELYVTLKQNEAITLWSDLSVATDICMVEAGALDGTYSVEGFEFSSASGSGEWFVKLEQPEEWPEKADGYVWMRAACIFDFAEDAEEEPEVKPNPYIPVNPSVPVIPENPELPDDVDVPILDENGDVITEEGKQLVAGAKATLSAWSVLGEDVSYQWQVCYGYDSEGEALWVDIHRATNKGLLMSAAMFENLGDEVLVRCITSDGDETSVSEPIPVILVDETDEKELVASAYVKARNTEVLAATETGTEQCYISIEYVHKDGTPAAPTWVVYLAKGYQKYEVNVTSPTVIGYKPNPEKIVGVVENIDRNITYKVTYEPDEVEFKVIHYFQNISSNNYSVGLTETKTGMTEAPVGTGLELKNSDITGFYPLLYDSTTEIAADGSTVVNIYYDRYYYLVNLKLDGGYGVEPIYARYETPIDANQLKPHKPGYDFNGWTPELLTAVPARDTTYTATWKEATAQYAVIFWYENANDNNYSYAYSSTLTGKTGTTVTFTEDMKNNIGTYFPKWERDLSAGGYDTHFEFDHADSTTLSGDGSSKINVYFNRKTYTLTFLHCLKPHHSSSCCSVEYHVHSNACCNLQHTSHSDSCCSIPYHVSHTKDCVTNELKKKTTFIPESDLDKAVPTRYNGVWIAYEYWGKTRYYIWFEGDWYRTADGHDGKDPLNWDCCQAGRGEYIHDHTSGCTCTQYHDHSSGRLLNCNYANCGNKMVHDHSSGCDYLTCTETHDSHSGNHYPATMDAVYAEIKAAGGGIKGTVNNSNYYFSWEQMTFKWQEDISDKWEDGIGGMPKATRWNPIAVNYADGTQMYNGSGVGLMVAMPDTNVVFRFLSNGSRLTTIYHYVTPLPGDETVDRTFEDVNYITRNEFQAYFGGWSDDYAEYAEIEGFTRPYTPQYLKDKGQVEQYEKTQTFHYYYQRKQLNLIFMNGSEVVHTDTHWFEEPITSSEGYVPSLPEGWDPDAYYFAGWYTSPLGVAGTEVDWNTKMPANDMTIYAKWSTGVPRTVSVTIDGGDGGSYTAIHGNPTTSRPDTPEKSGFRFTGWFYKENGIEKAFSFDMPVFKNLEVYARWVSTELASATIKYMIQNTTTPIADETYTSGLIGETKTYDAKSGGELYSDYQTGYFPVHNSHNIEFLPVEADNNPNDYTFYYVPRESVNYTVQCVDVETGNVISGYGYTDSSSSSKITVTFITIPGYTADAYSKDLVLSSDEQFNVLTFYYEKDTEHAPIQRIHMAQYAKGDGYEVYKTVPAEKGIIGETYSEPVLDIEGFVLDTKKIPDNLTLSADGKTVSGILTDEGLLFELYYNRIEYPYEFRFLEQGTDRELLKPEEVVDANSVKASDTARFEATVSFIAPIINGYEVSTGSQSMNIAVEESATAVKNVRIFYYVQDVATLTYEKCGKIDAGGLSRTDEVVMAVTGTAKGSVAEVNVDSAEDYYFAGWFSDSSCNNLLTTDTELIPEKTASVWIDTIYYAKFAEKHVAIHYKLVGDDGILATTTENVDVLTGTPDGSSLKLSDSEHYRFVGWYNNQQCEGQALSTDLWYVPTKNAADKWIDGTTYYAKVVEQKAKITYTAVDVSGMNEGEVTPTYESIDMVTGKANGSTASTDSSMHEFAGWYSDAEFTTEVGANAKYVPSKEDDEFWENTTYYAKFQLKEFTISFEPGDGMMDDGDPITYKYGDNVTLPEVTKEGYTAVWVVKEDVGSWEKDDEIKSGTMNYYGNVTLVPKWTPNEYVVAWVNYDFDPDNPSMTSILWYTEVEYNTMPPAYGGSTPTRPDENGMRYTFTGWDKDVTAPITNHTIYVAQYTSAPIYTKLTIETKDGNPNQNYVFTVTGTPKNKTLFGDSITLRVAVIGNSSVTIQDLPAGTYIVQENGSWAWRQLVLGDKDAELDGDTPSATVTFNYGPEEQLYWLNGYNYNRKKGVSN